MEYLFILTKMHPWMIQKNNLWWVVPLEHEFQQGICQYILKGTSFPLIEFMKMLLG